MPQAALSSTVTYLILGLAMLCASVRLLRGPTVFDRIIALDLIVATIMGGAAVFALETSRRVYLEVSLVIALIAFIGTVALARYLQSGDKS